MAIPITRTKVILPRRRSDLLTRQRLLDFLVNLVDYKLVIITAPAGYGKTSLLVDFAHHTALPVCWYSLDALDVDLQRFLAHFLAAISHQFPEFGDQSTAFLEAAGQEKIDIERMVHTIVNDAFEHIREHFLVVLDDYHLVNENKEIDYFINRFIQEVNENCHLVLAMRTLLTLPDMPLMVARSQVTGLSFEELAFRPDEIQSLVLQNKKISLSPEVAEELVQETEGWITGLMLSTQTMWQGMVDRLRMARVSGVGLYDYLAQQVLEQQTPQVQDFLLQASYLEEFDAELCNSVLGVEQDWAKLIDIILQNNLFVLPVGEDGRWIRFHHLFRDFLQARLEQKSPQLKESLLRKIGQVYAERRDWDKAYTTYRKVGDPHALAQLIDRSGSQMISSGRMLTIYDWLNTVPDDILVSYPTLLSLKGVIFASQGKVDQGLILLNQAVQKLRNTADEANLALALVRRATAYRFQGKYQDSYDDAIEAFNLSDRETLLRKQKAEALRTLGVNLYFMGQMKEAIVRYTQSLEIYEALGDTQNVGMLLMELGLVYMNTGQYNQALIYYQQSLEFWQKTGNSLRVATLYNNMAVLYHLLGNYNQAVGYYEAGLTEARKSKHLRTEAYILSGIGDLYGDLRAFHSAAEAYQKARELSRQIDYRFLLFYLDLAEAAQARRTGKVDQARQLLDSASYFTQEGRSSYEKAQYALESGQFHRVNGRIDLAITDLGVAASAFEEGGQLPEAARAYLFQASAYFEKGDKQNAMDRLGRAFALADNLDSQHVLVVAGQDALPLLEAAIASPYQSQRAEKLLSQVLQFGSNIPSYRRQFRPHVVAVPFAPPKLSILSLGKTQVELDGNPVAVAEWLNQKKGREFFFFLLCHPDGMTKEELGVLFWPDSSSEQLKLQFKNTIYRLRFSLGQDVISYNNDVYWFNRKIDYDYDAESFEGNIKKARLADNQEERVSKLNEALSIYKGPFLAEMDSAWVIIERERLWLLFVDVSLELGQVFLERGDYAATLGYCQKILTVDMCMEEAHRLAMRAHALKGNRAAVKRQFESCRKALLEEIQSLPSPQTLSLYEALKG